MANKVQSKRDRSKAFWRKNASIPQKTESNRLAVRNGDGRAIFNLNHEMVTRLRQLHNRLGREGGLPDKFGLTSALRGEGVTTVALGLGGVMASDLEENVCVVELNWWWPEFAELAGVPDHPGLAQVVAGAPFEDALLCTGLDNLYLLPAGRLNGEGATRLAHSQTLRSRLDELNERFDYLILDIPAVLATGDSLPLSSIADQIGLVVRAGITPSALVQQAVEDINHLPLTCVVLNGEKISMPDWLYRLIPEY